MYPTSDGPINRTDFCNQCADLPLIMVSAIAIQWVAMAETMISKK